MKFARFGLVLLLLLAPTAVVLAQDAGTTAAPVVETAAMESDAATPAAGTPDGGQPVSPAPAVEPTAPPPPVTVEDAAESVSFLVDAAKGGKWSLFVGVLLTLLVWVLDRLVKLKDRVGSKALPWVAAGLGILTTMGISLSSGLPLAEGLVQGFMTGATSVGLWELVFKHALKPKEDAA